MELLKDMALFVAVARTRNFSRAAKTLGMPISTLSRRLSALEAELRIQLVNRSTRGVELTEAGAAYYARCSEIIAAAEIAHEELLGVVDQARGTVRVSATSDFALVYLSPLFVKFAELYPQVSFEFDLTPRRVDLIAEGFDVAIRVGALPDSALMARRIAETRLGLFASDAYLRRAGTPRKPAELGDHECLRILVPDMTKSAWTLLRKKERVQVDVRGRFAINNIRLIHQLALQGLGIGIIDEALAADHLADGTLRRVLPAWRLEAVPIWAITPSRLLPARTRLLLDCLIEHIGSEQARVRKIERR